MEENIKRACSIYCSGPILHYIQISNIYNDSKTFVDMPMKYNPEIILNAFNLINNPYNITELKIFLNKYFNIVGSDLNEWIPNDFKNIPNFLNNIDNNNKYKQWGYDLNQLWLVLGRQVNQSVIEYPQRHSFVPRNYPMIVPGGRFRESYYWDTWWIVRGLLVCDMPLTAKYVILNLMDDVTNFGFIPNGGRIYYLDRSQPPLLSEMIVSWLDYMGWSSQNSTEFLQTAYPILKKEYNWWMNPKNNHYYELYDSIQQQYYGLNIYHSNETTPRPESYLPDLETAEVEIYSPDWEDITPSQAELYRNIRTGAETGWDFSSRWFHPILKNENPSKFQYNLSTIDTTHIIPVDLNSYMYKFELNLARIATQVGDNTASEEYQLAANKRKEAINKFLWNETTFRWNDYNTTSNHQITSYGPSNTSSISSFIPLWAGLIEASKSNIELQTSILESLQSTNLIQSAGILTTNINSGQQWDAPNSWPPLVLLIVEGLQLLTISDASTLANKITSNWLETCYLAYNKTGYMYEKYNAYEIGVGGGGGEYTPQIGFGWSNGVSLVMLNYTYSNDNQKKSSNNDDNEGLSDLSIGLISTGVILLVFLLCGGFYYYFTRSKNDKNDKNEKITTNLVNQSTFYNNENMT